VFMGQMESARLVLAEAAAGPVSFARFTGYG
jgi:hypothetical protein